MQQDEENLCLEILMYIKCASMYITSLLQVNIVSSYHFEFVIKQSICIDIDKEEEHPESNFDQDKS